MISEESLEHLNVCRINSLGVILDIPKIEELFRAGIYNNKIDRIIVTGSIENRFVILFGKENNLLICLGKPIFKYKHITVLKYISIIQSFTRHIHLVEISEEGIVFFTRPRVQLVSLCHPENFPFPRFPLGISNIAEAMRGQLCGNVSLADMQLGESIDSIVNNINYHQHDIVGISITFGQQDILEKLIETINTKIKHKPLIIVGGSLASLTYQYLLNKYPKIIVCMGHGEKTMIDLVNCWRNEIDISSVCNVAYKNYFGELLITKKYDGCINNFNIPALDLLEKTLSINGVMQLEMSRGCSHACSFCPRGHKGKWSGYSPFLLKKLLPYISETFNRYPSISRKIFLVDEECIGYRSRSCLGRMTKIANILSYYNFCFEANARIDQVYRCNETKIWHTKRMKFLKSLATNGLDRILFGIESGVDTVLERFNKRTTKEQNIYAIRMLSACNVPVRYTYITYDPMMTIDELIETYKFQGRKDLVLQPLPYISNDDIYEIIHNESMVDSLKTDLPLYLEISYLLVSLECLFGSPYYQLAKQKGLARKAVFSMGKRVMAYLQPEIEMLSYFSQLWIDHNFAFDYTLKSLIKLANNNNRHPLYALRSSIKESSYILLGKMIFIITNDPSLISNLSLSEIDTFNVTQLAGKWNSQKFDCESNMRILTILLNGQMELLSKKMNDMFNEYKYAIPMEYVSIVERSIERWNNIDCWNLINEH